MSQGLQTFDVTAIGSGPGGYRIAVLAALRGRKVAVIERAEWGGTCLNRGCVPKKDWHHTARWIENSRHFADRGVVAEGALRGDMAIAWRHQRKVVETVQRSYVDYLKRLGVSLFQGHGRFLDRGRIAVDGPEGRREIATHHSIIATGSAPSLPGGITTVPGKILTSDMLFDDGPPPGERVLLVGSGVTGVEFAYIFTMLGKKVTWLVSSPALSRSLYSPQARNVLEGALARLGIEAQGHSRLEAVETEGDSVRIRLQSGESFTGDWALLATGRHPYTDDLGLEAAGVETDGEGFVRVDPYLQTTAPGIYAIGDVVGPHMNANQAIADAALAVHNILTGNTRQREPLWVPELVYSAVELARIGMNDDLAEDEGFEPAVGFAAFGTSPQALGQDDTAGFVRLLADMDSGALLGGEIIGGDAGELIHLLSLIPDRDTALRLLADGRFNHPARAEELLNVTETLAARWGLKEAVFGEE